MACSWYSHCCATSCYYGGGYGYLQCKTGDDNSAKWGVFPSKTYLITIIRTSIIIVPQMTLHVYVVSHCFVDHEQLFRTAMGIYNLFLLFFLMVLSFLTSFVKSETFRREAHLSLRATALIILPLPILTVAYTVLRFGETVDVQAIVWIRVALTVIFPVLIVIVLFVPNVSLPGWYCGVQEFYWIT